MKYDTLLTFHRQSEDFVLGFEAGRLWERIKDDPGSLDGQPFHSANSEMVLRMIETEGADLTAEFTPDDGWMILRAHAAPSGEDES